MCVCRGPWRQTRYFVPNGSFRLQWYPVRTCENGSLRRKKTFDLGRARWRNMDSFSHTFRARISHIPNRKYPTSISQLPLLHHPHHSLAYPLARALRPFAHHISALLFSPLLREKVFRGSARAWTRRLPPQGVKRMTQLAASGAGREYAAHMTRSFAEYPAARISTAR